MVTIKRQQREYLQLIYNFKYQVYFDKKQYQLMSQFRFKYNLDQLVSTMQLLI